MSYAERIRHPSGTLSPAAPVASSVPEESWWERHWPIVLLLYAGLVAFAIYGLWRAGTIEKVAAAAGAVIPNPQGWV
ncbi:MAG TPA: hypothetical protein VNJ52_04790 [Patescibacteria group bacterium]|nr:hypothetical protein [Patescibacteria group bacterium]